MSGRPPARFEQTGRQILDVLLTETSVNAFANSILPECVEKRGGIWEYDLETSTQVVMKDGFVYEIAVRLVAWPYRSEEVMLPKDVPPENVQRAQEKIGFALFNLHKGKTEAVETLLRKAYEELAGHTWDGERRSKDGDNNKPGDDRALGS